MIFNGLTDKQAEKSRRINGSNRASAACPVSLKGKLSEHFSGLPAKIYIGTFLVTEVVVLLREITFDVSYNVMPLFFTFLWQFLAGIAAIIVAAWLEYVAEKRTDKLYGVEKDIICHVYRCGNTIVDLPESEIVKDDYVLLQKGDIVPADGAVMWGDITVKDDNGDRLVKSGEAETAVFAGTPVTSGSAVIKVTAVGRSTVAARLEPAAARQDKTYRMAAIIGYAAAAVYMVLYIIFRGKTLDGYTTPLAAAVFGCALFNGGAVMMLFCGRLKKPRDFFMRMSLDGIHAGKISMHKPAPGADIVITDKTAFITDGNAEVSGFTDGTGESYTKHSEIPYPLGTLLAAAIAETTPALYNRNSFFCSTSWKCAELRFISGRIKKKSDLNVSAADISDVEKVSYTHPVCGYPAEIIPKCRSYYDRAGQSAEISNTIALAAMSDELYYQGNRVIAFADETTEGNYTLIGFLTIHEGLRQSSALACKAMSRSGISLMLLADDSLASAVSLSDKAVTGATNKEIFSADKIAELTDRKIEDTLPLIKIITGEADRGRMIRIAKESGLKVASAVVTYDELEASSEADIIFAAENSCSAAKQAADSVVYGGIAALRKADMYNNSIHKKTVGYLTAQLVLSLIIAAAALFLTATLRCDIIGGFIMIAAAVVNTLLPVITGGVSFSDKS